MDFTITNETNNNVYFAEGKVPPNGTLVVNYVTKSMENAEEEGTISILPARIGDDDISMSDDIAYSGGGTAVVAGTADKATGNIGVGGVPANNGTAVINGRTFTFKTSLTGADYEVLRGASASAAITNLLAAIAAYPDDLLLNVATYANGTTQVDVEYKTDGEAGNAFTLAVTGANLTVSGATLTGGLNAYNVPALASVHATVSVAIATAFRELALFRAEINRKMQTLIGMRQGARPL